MLSRGRIGSDLRRQEAKATYEQQRRRWAARGADGMNVSNYVVKTSDGAGATTFLRTPAPAVNFHLMQSSLPYRQTVFSAARYLSWFLDQTFDDGGRFMAISAVKLGLPFRMLAYRHNNLTHVCVNPDITYRSPGRHKVDSACCCLGMKGKVKVERFSSFNLRYLGMDGQTVVKNSIDRYQAGMHIQHEYDHLDGVLVTDPSRAVEEDHLGELVSRSASQPEGFGEGVFVPAKVSMGRTVDEIAREHDKKILGFGSARPSPQGLVVDPRNDDILLDPAGDLPQEDDTLLEQPFVPAPLEQGPVEPPCRLPPNYPGSTGDHRCFDGGDGSC